LEDDRVSVRYRLALLLGLTCVIPAVSGCRDSWLSGPLFYLEAETLTKDVPGKSNLAGKLKLQQKVRDALSKLYGEDPRHIRVPDEMGDLLTGGGARLANYQQVGESPKRNVNEDKVPIPGGFGLYRRHCLHCHGVSGAGDGPTAAFLYPIPRDYRKGMFKFTSTPYGFRPHREDLKRTVRNGLHGTSMPAFEALMTEDEIEQVVDYVIFLSIRGETERDLIEIGMTSDENDLNSLSMDDAREAAQAIFNKWKTAQGAMVNPPTARTASTRESIMRGRELFLGRTPEKLDCTGCHGTLARGDGLTFPPQEVFNRIVFGGNPSEREERVKALDDKTREVWNQKLDEWGNPIRPANLNRGVYKGGRRPLDLYWRIAKGITGANMPPAPGFNDPNKIWDLVNFVLALPYNPDLLRKAARTPQAEAARTAGR
jgi:mono/diheme cytochrome c family protein